MAAPLQAPISKVIVFDDWAGGDDGRRRPAEGQAETSFVHTKIKAGTTFRAVNAWAYPSGFGPRPPVQDAGVTGLPAGPIATFNVLRTAIFQNFFIIVTNANAVYRATVGYAQAAALVGTTTSLPNKGILVGNFIHYTTVTPSGSRATVGATGGIVELGGPVGVDIAIYGESEVLTVNPVSGGLTGNSLLWSKLHDTTTYPAANTVEVGFGQTIAAIYPQRNGLVICMTYGDIWVITGALGSTDVLRKVDTGIGHLGPLDSAGAVLSQSSVWWCGGRDMVNFTGAQLTYLMRPDIPAVAGFDTKPWAVNPGHVLPLGQENDFVLIGTSNQLADATVKTVWMQAFRPTIDNWTRHSVPVATFSSGLDSNVSAGSLKVQAETAREGVVYFATSPTSPGVPKVYALNSRQEFPHVPVGVTVGNTQASSTLNDGGSGAPVIATYSTAEMWDGQSSQVRVNSVLIDYSYNPNFTPAATYNKFDVSVEALQSPGTDTVKRSAVQTFLAPAAGDNPDGSPMVRGQALFQVGDQGSGMGFRVRLDDWRGIMVHRITCLIDVQPGMF